MTNITLLSRLFNSEDKGNQFAKEQVNQIISSVIAKIDAVVKQVEVLADTCVKSVIPLCLLMQPNQLPVSTTPIDRHLLNDCARAVSPMTRKNTKDGYENS